MLKNLPANAADTGLIPGLRRCPRGGNGNPLQHSCLRNSKDRGALVGYRPWGHKELDTTEHTHERGRRYGFNVWSGKIPHAVELLSPHTTTIEPVLLGLRTATTELTYHGY